jgi:hypothetical protein
MPYLLGAPQVRGEVERHVRHGVHRHGDVLGDVAACAPKGRAAGPVRERDFQCAVGNGADGDLRSEGGEERKKREEEEENDEATTTSASQPAQPAMKSASQTTLDVRIDDVAD